MHVHDTSLRYLTTENVDEEKPKLTLCEREKKRREVDREMRNSTHSFVHESFLEQKLYAIS